MTVREGVVAGDGAQIHYLDWQGAGPPLVLIHATGFLAALWRPIAERLAGRFRVVAMDQRGHGDSPPAAGPEGYRFEAFADDLQRLINTLELERPIAAGHSSGGTTIVVHAQRHPGVLQRAVLIEPILPRPEWYQRPPNGRNAHSLAEGARRRRAVWPSREELYESYRGKETFANWRADVLRLYVNEGTRDRDDGRVELKCAPHDEAMFFEAVAKTDAWPALAGLRCPALVLWGAESHLHARGPSTSSGQGLAEQVQEALPNGRTVVVPEAGHLLPQERPDEVARLIEEFLAD
jgi:pimeloyl-ACP methyl ester carboxylesterase